MKAPKVTLLGLILLGLLEKQSQSGYDLQRLFATTPLMSYSSSPGAIYPALHRLQQQELISARTVKAASRTRRMYTVTDSGVRLLRDWLREPVSQNEVTSDIALLMLRFSFMDRVLGPKRSLAFLIEAEAKLAERAAHVKAFFRSQGKAMSRSGRLALDFGVRSYDTLLGWMRDAITDYENRAPTNSVRSKSLGH